MDMGKFALIFSVCLIVFGIIGFGISVFITLNQEPIQEPIEETRYYIELDGNVFVEVDENTFWGFDENTLFEVDGGSTIRKAFYEWDGGPIVRADPQTVTRLPFSIQLDGNIMVISLERVSQQPDILLFDVGEKVDCPEKKENPFRYCLETSGRHL